MMIQKRKQKRKTKSRSSLTSRQTKQVGSSQFTKDTSKGTVKSSSKEKDTKSSRQNRKKHPQLSWAKENLRPELKSHIRAYKACEACNLCENAYHSVFFRGSEKVTSDTALQPDILFIGEAPGSVEDVLGKPFTGQAGRLLDQIIHECNTRLKRNIRYAITNIVACVPYKGHEEINQPKKTHAEACSDRLYELIQILQPNHIILLGKTAKKFFSLQEQKGVSIKTLELPHPAHLLRMRDSDTQVAFSRCVLRITKLMKRGTIK